MPSGADATLEGWEPKLGPELTLSQVVDLAFDYRGNVTVMKTDGSEVTGYLFNRDDAVPAPFVQLFDESGNGPIEIAYAQIESIRFTGNDPAAGNSYEAYKHRRDREQATGGAG